MPTGDFAYVFKIFSANHMGGSTKRSSRANIGLQLTDQQRMALKRKQRTNRMLIAMVVAFSVSWIWSVTFNVLRDYDYLPWMIKNQEYLFGIATHCIAMTSTVWNPLLYAALNLQLRAAFIDLLPGTIRWKLRRRNDSTTNLTANGTLHIARPVSALKYAAIEGQQQV
ncbi:hypothetical protein KIN20_018204 [Parelaphostrongylus tenuis]|uniref:G-protein coupled receptors family 1 profile domain-containing protein n=1 Tax=Parelaphostrongylus tenuis TaxID=148309 RepID=A0AAD5MIY7_PARTN|nr:hypothetical protein KIN20_018204 [Parelaphostrongylus tenuis]